MMPLFNSTKSVTPLTNLTDPGELTRLLREDPVLLARTEAVRNASTDAGLLKIRLPGICVGGPVPIPASALQPRAVSGPVRQRRLPQHPAYRLARANKRRPRRY